MFYFAAALTVNSNQTKYPSNILITTIDVFKYNIRLGFAVDIHLYFITIHSERRRES